MVVTPFPGAATSESRYWYEGAGRADKFVFRDSALPDVHGDGGQALATALALLLCGVILVADSRVQPDDQAMATRQWLETERKQALDAVRATAIDLPSASEAELAEGIRTARWENRQLVADLDRLKAQYAAATRQHSAGIAELQVGIDQVREDLGRERAEKETLQSSLRAVMSRQQLLPALEPFVHRSLEAFAIGAKAQPVEPPRSTVRQATLLPVEIAAWKIADGLEKTRKKAMLSNQEQTFTVDVERRVIGTGSSGQLVSLDPSIGISLYTARTEVVDNSRGSIRFFPNGTATGGLIDLVLDGRKAAVKVRWSDGAVIVAAVQE